MPGCFTTGNPGYLYEGVNLMQSAQLITVYNMGFMLASLIFGPLGDVIRRYQLIVTASVLFILVGLFFAWVRNFPAALILRFCGGFFGGMLTVNLWSGLMHEVPKSHFNTALGLMAGTRAYSIVLGLPLVMKLVDWIGWTPAFVFLGSALILPMLLYIRTSSRPEPEQQHGSLNPFVHFPEALRLPGTPASLAGFFCVRVAGSASFVFTSLWLFGEFTYHKTESGQAHFPRWGMWRLRAQSHLSPAWEPLSLIGSAGK